MLKNFLRLLFFFLSLLPHDLSFPKEETKIFSQAYEAESKDPHTAVKLYEDILKQPHFDPALKNAARWRLLHLQHKLLYVPEFFNTLESLGRNKEKIQEKLITELCLELGVEQQKLLELVAILKRSPAGSEPSYPLWQFLMKETNPVFKTIVIEYYTRQGNLTLVENLNKITVRQNVFFAISQAIQKNQYENAKKILSEVNFSELAQREKAEYLYLVGKLYAKEEQCHPAVMAYRRAINYLNDTFLQSRYFALAGFTLYHCQRYAQAWGLLRQRREGYNEPNLELLRLILWAEQEKAPEAKKRLERQKSEWQEKRGTKYSPRLVDHAMRVLQKTERPEEKSISSFTISFSQILPQLYLQEVEKRPQLLLVLPPDNCLTIPYDSLLFHGVFSPAFQLKKPPSCEAPSAAVLTANFSGYRNYLVTSESWFYVRDLLPRLAQEENWLVLGFVAVDDKIILVETENDQGHYRILLTQEIHWQNPNH